MASSSFPGSRWLLALLLATGAAPAQTVAAGASASAAPVASVAAGVISPFASPAPPEAWTPAARRPDRCPASALEKLHREAPSFLVEVHARQGAAAAIGVVVAPDRVVVPMAGVLDGKWPVTVYFQGGARSAARVWHEDARRNLAVLVVESPPPGLVPRAMAATPPLGTTLLTSGEPLHDGATVAWGMREATVSNTLGERFAVSPAPAPGAPLLTCEGELVGIQTGVPPLDAGEARAPLVEPASSAVGQAALSALRTAPEKTGPRGYISFLGGLQAVGSARPSEVGLGLRLHLFEGGLAPNLFWRFNLGAQALWRSDDGQLAGVTSVSRWRLQPEILLGYRYRLGVGSPSEGFAHVEFTPLVGLALRTDHARIARLRPDLTTEHTTEASHHLDPMIGLSARVMDLSLTYMFQLDTSSASQSIHTVGLGYGF